MKVRSLGGPCGIASGRAVRSLRQQADENVGGKRRLGRGRFHPWPCTASASMTRPWRNHAGILASRAEA